MASTDPMDSLEGTLYYCTNPNADESTSGAVWVTLGYVTGFSVTRNKNKRVVYNKLTKVCSKKGRYDYKGSITQLYTIWNEGVCKLFTDDNSVALKLEVDKDITGVVTETRYFSIVDFDNAQESYGDMNNGGEVTISCDFTFSEDHVV
jgi:hypothetical protein